MKRESIIINTVTGCYKFYIDEIDSAGDSEINNDIKKFTEQYKKYEVNTSRKSFPILTKNNSIIFIYFDKIVSLEIHIEEK